MKPATPNTERSPSSQLRKAVFGGSPKKAALLLFSIAVLLAGGAATVHAQSALDGFDPSVSGSGNGISVNVIVVQPDGKILIGGNFIALSPNGGTAVTRTNIARVNADGTLDTAFNPNANGQVLAIALQTDGKIVIGGQFTTLSPNGGAAVTRNCIARINTNGTLDTAFNPNANSQVKAIALQTDGKILVGGGFTLFAPNGGANVARNRIARLDAVTGAPDSWNPNANNNFVNAIAVQADGKILVGGDFLGGNGIGGQSRNRIARLDAVTGAADSWNPNANTAVYAIAVQADGKILADGDFNSFQGTPTIGGQTRNFIARLDATNGLADSWNPNANNTVYSFAVQADGKILVSGQFNSIGGGARYQLARLDAVTGVADSFAPNPEGLVYSIAVQPDGKIIIGGTFAFVDPNGGASVRRVGIARLQDVRPPLNIQRRANTNVVLSWATNFTGFTLEASTNLNTNVWSVVSPAPALTGTNNVVTNAISSPARFYRLRQ